MPLAKTVKLEPPVKEEPAKGSPLVPCAVILYVLTAPVWMPWSIESGEWWIGLPFLVVMIGAGFFSVAGWLLILLAGLGQLATAIIEKFNR
jgi:hypothetical protein